MKKAPTVRATRIKNLKNQKLKNTIHSHIGIGDYVRLPRKSKTIVQKCNFPYFKNLSFHQQRSALLQTFSENALFIFSVGKITAGTANSKTIPVLNCGSWILAASHTDHDDGEEEEETGHGKAHPVDRLIANNDLTVHLPMNSRYRSASFTKTRNLLIN